MKTIDVPIQLDEDATWLCQHVGTSGQAVEPTRLRLDQTLEYSPGRPSLNSRRWIRCPDCGTYWRVWVQLRVAKPSVEWNVIEQAALSPRYCRAPICDIDRLIDIVKRDFPDISVVQHQDAWPADDEGV